MKKSLSSLLKIVAVLLVFAQAACAAPPASVLTTGGQPAAAPTPDRSNPGRAVLIQYSGGVNTDQLALIDLKTGELVEGTAPVKIGAYISYAYSPERTRLAVAAKDESCAGYCLRIFNVKDLRQLESVALPGIKSSNDSIQQMVFAPRGDGLALTSIENRKGRFTLVDLSKPGNPSLRSIDFPYAASLLAFSPGGDKIMMAAHPLKDTRSASPDIDPRFYALLLDTGSLRLAWEQELDQVKDGFFGPPNHNDIESSYNYTAALVADAPRQRLYIAHADADRLTTVDFERQQVRTTDIQEKRAWLDRLAEWVLSIGARPVQAKAGNNFFRQGLLSPDGRILYLVGEHSSMTRLDENDYESTTTNFGLQAWEIDSGLRVTQVETEAYEIRSGANGEILLLGYDRDAPVYHPFTQVYDPATGKIAVTRPDTYAYPTLSTNGFPVLVSSYSNDTGAVFLAYFPNGLAGGEPLWNHTLADGYAYFPELR